jgi:hypothetical protein
MPPIIYLKAFKIVGMDKCKGKDVNMYVLIDSFQQKMTDVLVAAHN